MITTSTRVEDAKPGAYVLIKRGLYWKPNSQGYTALLSEAGLYTDEESRGYAGGAHDGMTYRVLASEADEIAPGANDESKARYWKGRTEDLLQAVKPFVDFLEQGERLKHPIVQSFCDIETGTSAALYKRHFVRLRSLSQGAGHEQ